MSIQDLELKIKELNEEGKLTVKGASAQMIVRMNKTKKILEKTVSTRTSHNTITVQGGI